MQILTYNCPRYNVNHDVFSDGVILRKHPIFVSGDTKPRKVRPATQADLDERVKKNQSGTLFVF